MNSTTTIVAAILSSGVVTAIVTALLDRRRRAADTDKTRVEGDSVLVAAANELVTGIRQELRESRVEHDTQVAQLRSDFERELARERRDCDVKIAELQAQILELRRQVREQQ